ncbi:hypothetical protein DFH08DRAFT_821298 [Mycena albidolilacea]|uniref:Uncharacterized protein n=1 Tax=Mycena albidolilacea TaxID=1033008 RepID=A0AAD6ZAW8_9AGAR|nr:hypothetical protein DFH08DRAFT_821298 [Mycena albidolilacea]
MAIACFKSMTPQSLQIALCGYREQVIGPAYSKNPFFGIKRTKEWVLPAPFATYIQAVIKVFSSVYFTKHNAHATQEIPEQDLRGCPCERSPEAFHSASRASSLSGHSAKTYDHFLAHGDLITDTLMSSPNLMFRKTFLFSLNQFHGCSEWYLQKQRNLQYLPSVNQYLSKILLDDWKIPPRTTNIAETSHAATNADTSTQLSFLPAILVSGIKTMCKHWNGPSECEHLSEQRGGWTLNYPLPSSAHHPGPLELHWNPAFELDPALEPNYHALGESDYAMADYNGSGLDCVLPLPPPSLPVQPPDTSAPSDISGPSRTQRQKREQEVDPANEIEGKRSRTASRRARGE